MTELATATILAALILVASIVSVEFGISVAIIEIGFGVAGASLFGLQPTPWIDFVGSFAGIVLTFLAGAETRAADRGTFLPLAVRRCGAVRVLRR